MLFGHICSSPYIKFNQSIHQLSARDTWQTKGIPGIMWPCYRCNLCNFVELFIRVSQASAIKSTSCGKQPELKHRRIWYEMAVSAVWTIQNSHVHLSRNILPQEVTHINGQRFIIVIFIAAIRLHFLFATCYFYARRPFHYSDVIMGAMVSEITSLTVVCSNVYTIADKGKHQSSASLAFVRGSNRWPVNSPHKWPVTQKMFPFDDVIMRMCMDWSILALVLSAILQYLKNHILIFETIYRRDLLQ